MDAFDRAQNGTPAYHWQTLVFEVPEFRVARL
jgi:hypothetical protein